MLSAKSNPAFGEGVPESLFVRDRPRFVPAVGVDVRDALGPHEGLETVPGVPVEYDELLAVGPKELREALHTAPEPPA